MEYRQGQIVEPFEGNASTAIRDVEQNLDLLLPDGARPQGLDTVVVSKYPSGRSVALLVPDKAQVLRAREPIGLELPIAYNRDETVGAVWVRAGVDELEIEYTVDGSFGTANLTLGE